MVKQIKFVDWVTFHVQNPKQLTDRGYPTSVISVYVFVNRAWNDMNNDRSKPQSQQVDDATVYITGNYDEAWDISHGAGFTRYVCAHCGGGLGLTQCHGCGSTFRDDHIRSGAGMPLPRKVAVFLLERGHVFGQDPEVVWQNER